MTKTIAAIIGTFFALFLLIFTLNLFGLGMTSFFAPKYRAVENKVFQESEQYSQGMVRDLENLQLEYIKADKEGKQSIRAIVLHRFSVYPEEKMPYNLRVFYNQLKQGN